MTAPQTPTQLEILAPFSGVLVPIESVPDPVFAQKMVGDGVSIDPISSELLAPTSGTVTQLHSANHALTITTESGVEVLIHIGLETVALKGEGFSPLVRQGDRVSVGQRLITFDPALVGRKAKSLLTQIVITNGERVASMKARTGVVTAGKDVILSLELGSAAPSSAPTSGSTVLSNPVILPNPEGLHARPAAVLVAATKRYTSELKLVRGNREVNARSVVAIMGLATRKGDEVQIKATGPDAAEAAEALERLLSEGCGEKPGDAPAAPKAITLQVLTAADENELVGVPASPGLAVGRIAQFRQEAIDVVEQGEGQNQERSRLNAALHDARLQIEGIKARLQDPSKAQILTAHQEILEDPDLGSIAIEGISAGKSAGFAWREAFTRYATQLESLDNPLLKERAGDIRDVGRRVLTLLAGAHQVKLEIPDQAILIAEELSPSDTAQLDPEKVLGFCTTTGGATSHVAILARSMGIPAICGIDGSALDLSDGTLVVLDGVRGVLRRNPTDAEVAQAQARITAQSAKREKEQAAAHLPAKTTDGHHIEVVANVTSAKEAREAVAAGAEGVGLLRSEFLFDNRPTAPTESEQAEEYVAVAEALGPKRTLVIRTLDVGGDKPLAYLPLPKEDNPFLGLRGVRVSLDRPDIFRTQLRAILKAAPKGCLHIMFPMISGVDELRAAKAILKEEADALGVTAKVGVMIEVPSAAITASVLAQEADFFSIGTNDLTQYCLAMDRGHPKLAKQADALHPAVLKLIGMTVEGAHKHGKWVGICGGIASDTLAVPVLVGLGVDELSVAVPSVASVKAQIARLSKTECEALAREILQMGTAAEVRARLASYVD
ncbi:MAG TPA: phosphoenolpyruvate--protein phosphotransferase [Holophaga sp.]|nr:phosphoenolpyruvate--protein phosphotransferase [Holophaga sp.]